MSDLSPEQVDEFIARVFPSTPGQGFSCEAIGDGYAVARWKFDASTLRPGGLISGPTQFAACDLALWFLTFTVHGLVQMAVTSDLHIRFLRPAQGGDLLARAELIRAGRTRLYGQVTAWVDGTDERPVAHAVGNYAMIEQRS